MKLLYFLFCYILSMFVLHGFVVKMDIMLTIYHRTLIPVLFLLLVSIVKKINMLPIRVRQYNIFPALYLIVLIFLGSLFYEKPDLLGTFVGLPMFLLVWIFSFIYSYDNPTFLKLYEKKLCIATLVLGGIGTLLELRGIFTYNSTRDMDFRAYYYNFGSFFVAYLIPLCLLFKSKAANFFVAFLAVTLFLTTKRGPLLGLVGAYLIYITFYEHKFKSLFKYALGLGIIAILICSCFPEYVTLFSERFDSNDDISSSRFDIWGVYINYYLSGPLYHQLLGFGNDSYAVDIVDKLIGERYSPHNSYIMICFWHGLISFILMLLFIFRQFRLLRLKVKEKKYFKVFVIYFLILIICSFYTPGFADSSYMSLLVYYMLGLLSGTLIKNVVYEKGSSYKNNNLS